MADKLKKLVNEIRPNAAWDIIKWLIFFGVAAMSYALSRLIPFLLGTPQGFLINLIIFLIGLALVIVGWVAQGRRNKKKLQAIHDELDTTYNKEITELRQQLVESNDNIASLKKGFEQEKTSLEADIKSKAENIDQYKTRIERLEKDNQNTHVLYSDRNSRLNTLQVQYGWLHKKANEQAIDISSCLVTRASFCYYTAADHLPRFIFAVEIYNKSVFDITIENEMEEYVYIGGNKLKGEKEIIVKPDKISASSSGSLTIEQRILPAEIELVTRCLASEPGAIFYLDKLKIIVKGTTRFPQVERGYVKLQESICSKDKQEMAAKELQKQVETIERLAYVTGMIVQATLEYESGHALSESRLRYLDSVINQALHNCFDDPKIIEEYYAVANPIPDKVTGQHFWLTHHTDMLRHFIKQQRQQMSKGKRQE